MDAETGSCLERSLVDRDGLCQFSLAGLQWDIAELQACWSSVGYRGVTGTRCNASCKLFRGAHADLIGRSITAAILLLVINHASMPLPTAAATFPSPPSSLPSCRTYKWLGIRLKHLGSAHLLPSEKIHNCLQQNHVLMTWRGLLRLRGSGQSADAEMLTDTGEDTMDVTRKESASYIARRLGAMTVESQIDSQAYESGEDTAKSESGEDTSILVELPQEAEGGVDGSSSREEEEDPERRRQNLQPSVLPDIDWKTSLSICLVPKPRPLRDGLLHLHVAARPAKAENDTITHVRERGGRGLKSVPIIGEGDGGSDKGVGRIQNVSREEEATGGHPIPAGAGAGVESSNEANEDMQSWKAVYMRYLQRVKRGRRVEKELGIEKAVRKCLGGDGRGPRGGVISLEPGVHRLDHDDTLFGFGELHVCGAPGIEGGAGTWEEGEQVAQGPVAENDVSGVGSKEEGNANTLEEGNGNRLRGDRRRDMRESKREVLREARGLGGAVVHGRWALTDRGGVGRFSDVTLEDCNGPTVTIMAGTWTFDQVTFRVTSKHAWLLCVTSLGEAAVTCCTFEGLLQDEDRTEGFGVCSDGEGVVVLERCVLQQLRYGILCSEQSRVWANRCVLRDNCIGLSLSHTAQLTLRASSVLAHSEGVIQVVAEHPGALHSPPASTLHLIDNVAYLGTDNDRLFRCPQLMPRYVIDRNNRLVYHAAPAHLTLPHPESPELYAVDGTPIDINEFAFEVDAVTGQPGTSKTLPGSWRVEWIATSKFRGLQGDQEGPERVTRQYYQPEVQEEEAQEEEEEGAQQSYAWYINDEEGRMQLTHPLVEMREKISEERECQRYLRALCRNTTESDKRKVKEESDDESVIEEEEEEAKVEEAFDVSSEGGGGKEK